jgi:hypothetical protein
MVIFRGRCQFRVHIPNKPVKQRIKLVMMCDCKTLYNICIAIFRKSTQESQIPLAHYFIKKLAKSIYGTNINITIDNWFTSAPLASVNNECKFEKKEAGNYNRNECHKDCPWVLIPFLFDKEMT